MRVPRALLVPALLGALCATALGQHSSLAPDEEVQLFPTNATLDAEGQTWTVPLHGLVFEPERDSVSRDALLRTVSTTLGLPSDSPANASFRARAGAFFADNERGEQLVLRIAGHVVALELSKADGHSRGSVELSAAEVAPLLAAASPAGWLPVTVELPAGERRRFEGRVRFLPPQGLLIVSDVDDTLRISEVLDHRALLRRTFLMPFEPVPGMAALYTRWAATGAELHYLSSSPWQLHEPLQSFLKDEGFPAGSLMLRHFRWKDQSFAEFFQNSEGHKLADIAQLAPRVPGRPLVLIGDSGERDPEIYGAVARQWPERVLHILIRDVTGERRDSERYEKAFLDVPPERWRLFTNAEELEALEIDQATPSPPSTGLTDKPW